MIMLEYLKEFNFKEEEIDSIIKSNDLNIVKNLELMKKNVKEVINEHYKILERTDNYVVYLKEGNNK